MNYKEPDLSFAPLSLYNNVYEPSEDSWIFLDSITEELAYIESKLGNTKSMVVEIGTGSGIILTHMAKLLQLNNRNIQCIGTDINPYAIEFANLTLKHNDNYKIIQTEFVNNLNLNNKIDILLFNPPYVISPDSELKETDDWIVRSWAGGINGREVTDILLPQIKDLLSERGIFYLLTIDQNKPNEIIDILNNDGFECKLIKRKKARNEQLQILRFTRKK